MKPTQLFIYSTVILNTAADIHESKTNAKSLLKPKRISDGLFEEVQTPNYERECMEEQCSNEELDEVFENDESMIRTLTTGKWLKYVSKNGVLVQQYVNIKKEDFRKALRNPCELQQKTPRTLAKEFDANSLGIDVYRKIHRCYYSGTSTCENTENGPYFKCLCRKGYFGEFCDNCFITERRLWLVVKKPRPPDFEICK